MRLIVGMACLAAAGAVQADVVTLEPSKDNTLYQSTTGAVSNGAGSAFISGKTNQNQIRRALMGFDVSSLPAGAIVTDVTLTLHCSAAAPGGSPVSFGLHRVLADWGEGTSVAEPGGTGVAATPGDATWIHRFYDTSTWATPGGDFVAGASASESVGIPGFYSWTGAGLVSDVQSWLDNPAASFGWILVGGEGTAGTARRFDSREIQDPSFRPALTITYVPAPGAIAMASVAGLAAARRRRR